MIDILKKLEEVLDEQPQEIHISEKKEKNEIFGVLSNALNTKDPLNIEQNLTESLERIEENLLAVKKSKKMNSRLSEQIYINDMKKKYGLESKAKKYENLSRGDILVLSAGTKKHPDIFVSFEEALGDGYFVGVPIDDSGQLGSEVSSMYDHTNLEGIFEDSEKFIVALNEMINVFHSSLIKGIAGKIKDISENKLFDYYKQKPMSVIEKVSDKRVNLRAKFFELVNYYSDSKNKDTNVGQIKYISYE